MKVLWYLVGGILLLLGALSLLRFGEVLAFGGGGGRATWLQLLLGVLFVALSWQCIKKGRAS